VDLTASIESFDQAGSTDGAHDMTGFREKKDRVQGALEEAVK